jgi:hypothetical protein
MKLPDLFSAVMAMIGLASTSLAADYADWVAKGCRWSLINGPYAYITKEDAKNGRFVDSQSVSEVVGHAYYLRPGKVVLLVETDAGSGLSKIRMGGVASDLWTATKNLCSRPIMDSLGVIESPDTEGVLIISSATPSAGSSAAPAALVSPSPTVTPSK